MFSLVANHLFGEFSPTFVNSIETPKFDKVSVFMNHESGTVVLDTLVYLHHKMIENFVTRLAILDVATNA